MIPISEKLANMINDQVAREKANQNFYLNIASWANVRGLTGIAKYFTEQSNGENEHAGWLMDILKDANFPLSIPAIPAKPADFSDCVAVANAYVEAEAQTTDAIEAISRQADAEYDQGVLDLTQRMLREQVEEEGSADRVLRLAEISGGNLILLDLAMRE